MAPFDRESFSVAQAPASSSNSAQVAFDKAMAAIDKVLANPKATQKRYSAEQLVLAGATAVNNLLWIRANHGIVSDGNP